MINWMRESNEAYSFNERSELPDPETELDCIDLIDQVKDLLYLFKVDNIQYEYDNHISEACEILEELDPMTVTVNAYQEGWNDQVRMWLFRNEILTKLKCHPTDKESQNKLKDICDKYLDLLKEAYEEFMGEPFDADNIGGIN